MNFPSLTIFAAILASFAATACQSTRLDSTAMAPHPPTPAPSPPAWVKNGDGKGNESKKYLIVTKLIERPIALKDGVTPPPPYTKFYTDPQFQIFIRSLVQEKGCDLMSAPSVVARGGQNAKIEIGAQILYPAKPGEDPPSQKEQTGITADLLVRSAGNGRVNLNVHVLTSELIGYYETSPELLQPVIKRRQINKSVEMKLGDTVLIGGFVDERKTDWEDRGPLGLISKSGTETTETEFIAAITVEEID